MAKSNSLFVHPAKNFYFAEDKTLKERAETLKETATNIVTSKSSNSSDFLQCFVCDALVQGKYYTLALCKTQSTRTRVIEKLGALVGERYMVVISEDDIICRSCANLVNTLDRLEVEMKTVKGTVLRYLERKYSLEDGELENNDTLNKSSQAATSTKENVKKKKSPIFTQNPISTNKKAISCDKCRYSTNYQTFMIHHIRQHINQKINCDKCGVQFIGNNPQNNSHSCKKTEKSIDNIQPKAEDFMDTKDTSLKNQSLPVLFPVDQNIKMKEEIDIETNYCDFVDDQIYIPEKSEQESIEEEQNIVVENIGYSVPEQSVIVESNVDHSLKQILQVREDGSLEMIQVNPWEENNQLLQGNQG